MPIKYVFVTGGVVSGLGKGITAASLGRLLKARGYKMCIRDRVHTPISNIFEAPGTDVISSERSPPVQLSAVAIVTPLLNNNFTTSVTNLSRFSAVTLEVCPISPKFLSDFFIFSPKNLFT